MRRRKGTLRLFSPAGADSPGMLEAPPPRLDPDLLSGPPRPVSTLYDYFPVDDPRGTAISRVWAEGEAERCDLCAECGRVGDQCLVLIHNRIIPPEDCPTYRENGRSWPRPAHHHDTEHRR